MRRALQPQRGLRFASSQPENPVASHPPTAAAELPLAFGRRTPNGPAQHTKERANPGAPVNGFWVIRTGGSHQSQAVRSSPTAPREGERSPEQTCARQLCRRGSLTGQDGSSQ